MRAYEFIIENELEEGWRERTAGLAAGAAMAYSGYHNATHEPQPAPIVAAAPVQQAQKPFASVTYNDQSREPEVTQSPIASAPVSPPTANPPLEKTSALGDYIKNFAQSEGMRGAELHHFISQMAHETLNFTKMTERGSAKAFEKAYGVKHNPHKAKRLGNVRVGDGERFRGRGFVQLTGRYNYRMAGRAVGLPLEQNPELASRPDVAARVALWYWNTRVKSKISDFNKASVQQVTKPINPGLKGLKSRQDQLKHQGIK